MHSGSSCIQAVHAFRQFCQPSDSNGRSPCPFVACSGARQRGHQPAARFCCCCASRGGHRAGRRGRGREAPGCRVVCAAWPAAGPGAGGAGTRVFAQLAAAADRSRSRAARRPGANHRGAQDQGRAAAAGGTGADRREPGLSARGHGVGHRLRGCAAAGDRQTGRAGGASGAGQLVGHIAQRPVGPPCRRRHPASGGYRSPARQGHQWPDGGCQDLAGDDLAGAPDFRAGGAPRLPGAGAWPHSLGGGPHRGTGRARPGRPTAHGGGAQRQAGAHRCRAPGGLGA